MNLDETPPQEVEKSRKTTENIGTVANTVARQMEGKLKTFEDKGNYAVGAHPPEVASEYGFVPYRMDQNRGGYNG